MEIQKLILQTDKLEKMKEFYTQCLGFLLNDESQESFQIKVGTSVIEFTNKNVAGYPYYHFALNIPPNQFQEAKKWLKGRTALLLEEGEDEADFSFWPAHSCYFEDPSGNIVEFVARYHVNPNNESVFSIHNILNISEIGLVVKDPKSVGKQLEAVDILNSDGAPITNSLNFMQKNNNGVFILLTGTGRRWLFSDKKSRIFPLKITLDNNLVLGVDEKSEFFID